MQEQLIWGAGLDVCDPEPMDAKNPLLNLPRVAIAPHLGSATQETRAAMAELAVDNLLSGLANERKETHLIWGPAKGPQSH